MEKSASIDRTEAALIATFVAGIVIAAIAGRPWAVFAVALALAALFAAVMHLLTRRARMAYAATHPGDPAPGHMRRPDPRARKRRRRR